MLQLKKMILQSEIIQLMLSLSEGSPWMMIIIFLALYDLKLSTTRAL